MFDFFVGFFASVGFMLLFLSIFNVCYLCDFLGIRQNKTDYYFKKFKQLEEKRRRLDEEA